MATRKLTSAILTVLFVGLLVSRASAQYGVALSGVGPVNRSMGGTATAAPIDAMGALYWNPATISALPGSSMEFGLELLYPQVGAESTVNAGAFGPGVPPVTLSGSDRSEGGVFPLPAFGLVVQPEDSIVTYGLGVFVAGGFGSNMPGNLQNPILSPPPPNGLGVGPIYSQYQVLQVVPTMAVQLTDRLSFGFAPIVDLATLSLDPAFFAAPDDANGNLSPTYPSATHTRFHWGMGFQLGLYYQTDSAWNFGASFKSPQWFETLRYHSSDEVGAPRTLKFGLDFPMIVSVGTSYTGFERLLVALDLRYIDYHNTKGFSQSGFDATGAVRGLGWDNVFALSLGSQYLWSDALALRGGYSFSTNPIDASETFFNVASPLLIQHAVYVGASYNLTCNLQFSVAYSHMFENSSSGPYVLPGAGAIGGTSVTSRAAADALIAGVAVRF